MLSSVSSKEKFSVLGFFAANKLITRVAIITSIPIKRFLVIMAITISVDSAIKSGEGTSLVTDSFTPLSGDSQILICVTVDDTTEGDITTVVDSEGATVTQIADFTNGNRRGRLYAIASPTLVSRTITVNFGSATDAFFKVFTIQGSDTALDPSDIIATSSGNSASPATTIDPTAGSGLIVWLTHASIDGSYSTLGSGQVERGQGTVGGAEKCSVLFTSEIFTDGASQSQSATRSKSGNWIGLAVEIKEVSGANLERTASQTITESDSVAKIKGAIRAVSNPQLTESDVIAVIKGVIRTVVQTITHSSVIDRGGSTFNRVGTTILTHIDSVARILGDIRTAVQTIIHSESVVAIKGEGAFERVAYQTLTHIDSVLREGSTFVRTVAQNITHSETIIRQLDKLRTAIQTLTHSESIVSVISKLRTAVQTLTHSSVVDRGGSTFERIGTTILTHIDAVARIKNAIRTVVQTITESDIVVAVKSYGAFERTATQILIHSESILRGASTFVRTAVQNLLHSQIVSRISSGDIAVIPTPQFGSVRTAKKRINALMSDGFNEVRVLVRLRENKREHLVRILNSIYYPYGLGTPVTVIRSIRKTFENAVKIINSVQKSGSTKLDISVVSVKTEGGKYKANIILRIFNYGSNTILITKKVFDKGMKNVRILKSMLVKGDNMVKVKSLPEQLEEDYFEG